MKKIFISREQHADSVFYKTLTERGCEVTGKSLIKISAVPFDSFPETDWIFFYSKNGVKHFFGQLKKPLPRTTKLAAIGPGTADYLEEHFAHPSFVGDGDAKTTSEAFLNNFSGKTVLFPRAQNSQRSVQKWLDGRVVSIDLVVYANSPLEDFDLPVFDCLVFTSPMNAKAYLGKHEILDTQQVVAIGRTTADTLQQSGLTNFKIASAPSELSLAEAVLSNWS